MTDEGKESVGFVGCMIIVALFATGMTRAATDWSWRRQIAGHHAAEFYIDGANYRQWRWLDCSHK